MDKMIRLVFEMSIYMNFLPVLIDSPKKKAVAHRRCVTSKVDSSSKLFDSPSKETKDGSVTSKRLEFFDAFRSISRMQQKRNYTKIENNPQFAYLKSLEQEKLFPMPMFEPKTRRLTNSFAKPYAEALHLKKDISTLDLQGNSLNIRSLSTILERLDSSELTHLNLSGNKIGNCATQRILKYLSSLKSLELEDCALSAPNIELISEELGKNTSLKFLNLAKNKIKDRSANALGSAISNNFTLKSLDLHWNLLSRVDRFFIGLGNNKSLTQLDLSWNCLGASFSEIKSSFRKFSEHNKSLKHLDISFNSIGKKGCTSLADSLLSNHTLLGIHTIGNACKVNSQGFIDTCEIQKAYSFNRLFAAEKVGENCWVCEKWIEGSFTVPELSDPCFVHLEFEDFEARKVESGRISVAMPYGTHKVFFSNLKGEAFTLQELEEVPFNVSKVVRHTGEVTIEVKTVNVLKPVGGICTLKNPFMPKPRMVPAKRSKVTENCENAEPWSISRSIFKDNILDTPELLSACFEFDWEHSKIAKLNFKDSSDLENCKNTLQKYYYLIKCAYKILSVNSYTEVFSISSNTLHEFLINSKIIDSYYKSSDFGVNWSASLIAKVKGKRFNPQNSLVRHEFLEILVRISADKYSNLSISAGVSKLMCHLEPYLKKIDYNVWRDRYFSEEIDLFIKENSEILKSVYAKYSGRKSFQGYKAYIQLEEFKDLCTDLGFITAGRSIDKCFTSSMFPQVNELDRKRHMEMSISEFYEALARVTDCNDGSSLLAKLRNIRPKLAEIAHHNKKERRRSNTVKIRTDLQKRLATGINCI